MSDNIFIACIETPRGIFSVIHSDKGIYRLFFPGVECPVTVIKKAIPWPGFRNALVDYFEGKEIDWNPYPLDCQGYSQFTYRVLEQVKRIPYGTRLTYRQVGENTGLTGGWRAVGQALKVNRHPLIVPCHRVVAKSGLGGYSGPAGWKKQLLELEEITKE